MKKATRIDDDVYTPLVNGIWCGKNERAQEMYLFSMFEFHFTKLPLRVQNGSIANSCPTLSQSGQQHQMKDGNLIVLIQFAQEGTYVIEI